MARQEVTLDEVKSFKQAWYKALLTGEKQSINLDKGRRNEVIEVHTNPQNVGFKDEQHLEDIMLFKNLVAQVRLLGIVAINNYVYLDQTALNMLNLFVPEQLVKSMEFIGSPLNDVRISSNSPIILTHVTLDQEKLELWMSTSSAMIEQEVGDTHVQLDA